MLQRFIWSFALLLVIPSSHVLAQSARPDTVWFGGDDGNGCAFEGGVWDWDTIVSDPMQGWSQYDPTLNPDTYFYWVTEADFIAHGDPCIPIIDGGMLWCGVHEDDAQARGFVGGMGYQNWMCQWARSPLIERVPPPAAQEIEIRFDYFNHSEPTYDYTHVYLCCLDAGQGPLDELNLTSLDGSHGSAAQPASFLYNFAYTELPPETHYVQLSFNMKSDGVYSDEDGLWDSPCGPFGVDNIELTMGSETLLWDFTEGAQGWTFDRCPAASDVDVVGEETWGEWLNHAGISCPSLGGNVLEFVDEELSPYWPPGLAGGSYVYAISGPIARVDCGPGEWSETIMHWDDYTMNFYWPNWIAMAYGTAYTYYPHSGTGGADDLWSPVIFDYYNMPNAEPECHTRIVPITDLPAEWDSLKVLLVVVPEPLWFTGGPVDTWGAPLFDNVRVGLVRNPSGIEDDHPTSLVLKAVPTVASTTTTLTCALPRSGRVELAIYDATGRRVRQIAQREICSGVHRFTWDTLGWQGERLGSGIYYARLCTADGASAECPILVLR